MLILAIFKVNSDNYLHNLEFHALFNLLKLVALVPLYEYFWVIFNFKLLFAVL
jgi:hypothetical protein